jgi:ribose transport system ATP-binding protein
LEARGIGKDYPGVRALDGVDFTLEPGEVHALVGENGAGKSTLVKVLSGEVTEYEGTILLEGGRCAFSTPRAALGAGVAVIPQEQELVTSLTAAENILLGREPRGVLGLLDRARVRSLARASLDQVGTHRIPEGVAVERLEAADRQLVAIARALSCQARCLIMDEPTASLGAGESARLEEVVRRLTTRDVGVIYVSHRLDEVLRLADRVTVLRDGRRVATVAAPGATEADLVRLMVGRDIAPGVVAPVSPDARELLRIEGLSVRDAARPDGFRLRGVSLTVRAGEILGLAGLVGAGRTDLLLALVGGLERPVTGTIRLDGRRYVPVSPADARDRGLVLVPEERKEDGIFPWLGVTANITVSALRNVSRLGWLDRLRESADAARMMATTGVRAAPATSMRALSGGNQQKALLARALYASPRVLLLDEPTRGIDLAAKAEIYSQLQGLAAQGYGIVLCSSEMSEILTQCHRIVVFREGRVTATFGRGEATEEKILAAAAGADQRSEVRVASRAEGGDGAVSDETGGGAHPPAPARPPGRWRDRIDRHAGLFGLGLVLVLAIVFSPVRGGRPVFLELGNLTDILRQVAEKGILAVGMTAVVITGGIDLSVGSILAFAATLSAWLLMRADLGLAATAAVVLATSALWGLLNGIVVARWRLPAFIVTLATMSAARGAARYLSGGAAIPLGFGAGGAPDSVRALAGPLVPYVPAPALAFVLSVVAMHLLLSRTRSGRYLYAIGNNESAARLSGVRVAWHKASVYVVCAALAGLAGLVHCAQLEQGNPNDGVAYELDAIAAVVVGGTNLSGGTGTVAGTLVGILIIGIINNSLGLNNVDANLQLILKGAIILVAVWLQRRAPA